MQVGSDNRSTKCKRDSRDFTEEYSRRREFLLSDGIHDVLQVHNFCFAFSVRVQFTQSWGRPDPIGLDPGTTNATRDKNRKWECIGELRATMILVRCIYS
jgi:hypothetical protein